MLDHHTFRPTGRTGGVDDVTEVVGTNPARWRVRRIFRKRRLSFGEINDRCRTRRLPGDALREHDRRRGVRYHVGETLLRMHTRPSCGAISFREQRPGLEIGSPGNQGKVGFWRLPSAQRRAAPIIRGCRL